MIKGPQIDEQVNRLYCLVCYMLAVGDVQREQDKQAAEPDFKQKDIWVTRKPELAVVMAIPKLIGPPMFGGNGVVGGMAPVCWNHGVGLTLDPGAALASPMDAPPGVLEKLASGKH